MAAKRLLSAFAGALLVLAPIASSWAVEKVGIRAGVHDGYGRLVFDWPKPVSFTMADNGLTLTLRFSRTFETDYRVIGRRLAQYVGTVTPGKDKKSVTFELLRPVLVNSTSYDNTVIVDLKQPLPAAGGKTPPVSPAQVVSVRGGEHGSFSRVVFDWGRDVAYRVQQSGNDIGITFNGTARLDTDGLAVEKLKLVSRVSGQIEGKGTIVSIVSSQDVRIRHMRVGRKIVVDILPSDKTAKDEASEPKAVAGKVAAARPSKLSPPAPPLAKPASATKKRKKPTATADKGLGTNGTTTASAPIQLLPKAGHGKPPKALMRPKASEREAEPKAAAIASAGTMPDVVAQEDENGADISFLWPKPVAAAAFERGGAVWIVFDQDSEFPIQKLGGGESSIQLVQQIPHRRATILRFKIRPGLFPVMRRDGAVWRLSLRSGKGGAVTTLPVVPQPLSEVGPRVFLPVIDTGRRVEFFDPEVGDALIVVPIQPSGMGVSVRHEFAEFHLLPTAQGVLIRPLVDDLDVEPLRNGITVMSAGGLSLTPPEVIKRALARPAMAAAHKARVMKFPEWLGEATSEFVEQKQAFIAAIVNAPRTGRNAARWQLARFFFAHKFIPETLGQLQLMQETDRKADRDPTFLAVRGVASLLAGRLEDARRDLMDNALDRFSDIGLWRGALLLKERRFDDANRQFAIGAGTYIALPAHYRFDLLLRWGEAAIADNDVTSFQVAAGMLKRHATTPRLLGPLEYLRGQAAELNAEIDTAMDHYRKAIDTDYRPAVAMARFAQVNAALKLNQIDLSEAVERLEKLRFVWRGDEFEVRLIRRLATLAFENGDNRRGLELLREGVTHFPEIPLTRELSKDMNRVFGELFLDGGADAISPVLALAIYYDFQELTPLGKPGDEMIGKLADRLVGVDLLDQAARLLAHQVEFRLKGLDRARIGTQLALISLLDKQPQMALDALAKSDAPGLPDEMIGERRYLQAQALSDLDRQAEALQLLAGDESDRARLLRADIHWGAQDWMEAALTMKALLGSREDAAQPLDLTAQSRIMKLAVALYMSDQFSELAQLGDDYVERMRDGPHTETFRLLTHTVDPSATEFRQLASTIADIKELEAFMTSYRTRLAQNGLSAVN